MDKDQLATKLATHLKNVTDMPLVDIEYIKRFLNGIDYNENLKKVLKLL